MFQRGGWGLLAGRTITELGCLGDRHTGLDCYRRSSTVINSSHPTGIMEGPVSQRLGGCRCFTLIAYRLRHLQDAVTHLLLRWRGMASVLLSWSEISSESRHGPTDQRWADGVTTPLPFFHLFVSSRSMGDFAFGADGGKDPVASRIHYHS